MGKGNVKEVLLSVSAKRKRSRQTSLSPLLDSSEERISYICGGNMLECGKEF